VDSVDIEVGDGFICYPLVAFGFQKYLSWDPIALSLNGRVDTGFG
jgi:hypothetical protein